jgi:membrane-bound serine protease (ClpP class)
MTPTGRRAQNRISPSPCTQREHSLSPSTSFGTTGEGSSSSFIVHRSSLKTPPHPSRGNPRRTPASRPNVSPLFLRVCLRVLTFSAVAFLFAGTARADQPATAPSPDTQAVIIQLHGEINDYTRDQLQQRINQVRGLGATNVILDIDTYGGIVTDGLEISRFLKRQNDLHIVAYVKDKAISAGAMIAMACNEIVMSNSASLGDCAPIIFGPDGLEAMPAAERAKAESPVLLDFAESAERNHHDPLLAASMVDVKRIVYWVQNDQGERKFVDDKQYAELIATKQWHDVPGAPVPIKGSDVLLTVDSEQAVQYGLATGIAAGPEDLAHQRGWTVVANISPGFGDDLVSVLSGPAVRALLIIIFLQCLYIVLHAPGHGVAESVGLIALLLMLGVPLLTGYAQWWEILVIFVGLSLVAVEIVIPGHFFPGITGGILVLFGLVMTFVPQGNGVPFTPDNWRIIWIGMQKGLLVVAVAMAISLVLWIWIGKYLPSVPILNKLIITATSGGPSPTEPPRDPAPAVGWPPIGAVGKTLSELRPGGSAEFFDPAIADKRITSVVSETGYVPANSEVIVRAVAGPSVIVRKKANA